MGCCSIKDSEKKHSKLGKFSRKLFFRLVHKSIILSSGIRSIINKRYKKIYRFHKKYYKKALGEIK